MKSFVLLTVTMLPFVFSCIAQNERINLEILGMTNIESSMQIHEALSNKEGIVRDELNYKSNSAIVEYDTDIINVKEIIQTIKISGYVASVKLLSVQNEKSDINVLDGHKEMSNCKADCPKPCCTNPDMETGRCTCSSKGTDCSLQCCSYKPDLK